MTKKEKTQLHSDKCQIITDDNVQLGRGAENRFIVNFSLTLGEMHALHNMISSCSSPVQDDVRAYFFNALDKAKIHH